MPRDANGNVTLPAGNPVVADTDITSDWANTTLADVAAVAEDSLSRSGKGGMLVPFAHLDGTVAAPGITFTNQTGTGFSRSASGLGVSVAGSEVARFTTAGLRSVAPGASISASSGAFSSTTVGYIDITNLTVSVTTAGGPVLLLLQPDPANSGVGPYIIPVASCSASIKIVRGTTDIAVFKSDTITSRQMWSIGSYLDVPAAGTYTYKLMVYVSEVGAAVHIPYWKLVAYPL